MKKMSDTFLFYLYSTTVINYAVFNSYLNQSVKSNRQEIHLEYHLKMNK